MNGLHFKIMYAYILIQSEQIEQLKSENKKLKKIIYENKKAFESYIEGYSKAK